jgi:hypothetical protein
MKFINIFSIFFFFLFHNSIFGQFSLPLDMFNIEDSLFSQKDLAMLGKQRISCTVIKIPMDSLNQLDTTETYEILFNQKYLPTKITANIFNFKNRTEVTYSYDKTYTFKKWARYDLKKSKNNEPTQTIYTELFNLNEKVSQREQRLSAKDGLLNIHFDTIIYHNHQKIREINYWYNVKSQYILDSIIQIYKYDSLARLTVHTKTPSKTFLINFPQSYSKLHELLYKSLYIYKNNIKTVTYSGFSHSLPQDSFFITTCTIKTIDINSVSKVEERNCINGTDYHFLISEPKLYSFEHLYGEFRNIKYLENTNLPKNIIISSDSHLLIYKFDYFDY